MGGDEIVDLVDEADSVIGSATLADCLDHGLLHRAVAVMVRRQDGRLVLQRRNKNDLWHPGLWTLSSTGHVKMGESYSAAAERELFEELGMRCPLRELTRISMPLFSSGRLSEREWVALFATTCESPFKPDPVELEEVREMSVEEAKVLMSGEEVTPDSKILLEKYFSLEV